MRIYGWLKTLPSEGLCGWLPINVHKKQENDATPRRQAWALREIEKTGYSGRVLVERVAKKPVAAGADAVASVNRVLQFR